jgi:hypothetical protein
MSFGWVAAGAVLGSAVIGSSASKSAANTQAAATEAASETQLQASREASAMQLQASRESIAAQQQAFNRQVELQAPFREAGLKGQNRLMDLLGISGDTKAAGYGSMATPYTTADMYNDPGYAFRLNEGIKALDRSAAARGGLLSGAQLKAVNRYGQEYAANEYANAFNRQQLERASILNPLQSVAGQAQTSANTLTSAAGNLGAGEAAALMAGGNAMAANTLGAGSAVAGNLIGAGNARASGYMGTANAITGAIGQGVNYYAGQQALNNQNAQFNQLMGLYNNRPVNNSTSGYW